MNKNYNLRLDRNFANNSCNYNCLWCHGDYFKKNINNSRLSFDEFKKCLEKLTNSLNTSPDNITVTIAGNGEPTLIGINELSELIHYLKNVLNFSKVKLTTNGSKLSTMAKILSQAGLDSVNISINSLNPDIYNFITGGGHLEDAIKSIEESVGNGIKTKINVCYSKLNAHNLNDYIMLSRKHGGIIIKFFDLLPLNQLSKRLYLPLENLILELDTRLIYHKCIKHHYAYTEYYDTNVCIRVKNSSKINDCQNIKCKKRSGCLEGCRHSIRIGSDGILKPCGIRHDNSLLLKDENINCNDIRAALKSGGKL